MVFFSAMEVKSVRGDILRRTVTVTLEAELTEKTLAVAQQVRRMAELAVSVRIVPEYEQGELFTPQGPTEAASDAQDLDSVAAGAAATAEFSAGD